METEPTLLSLVPMIIVSITIATLNYVIARRKVENGLPYFLASLIPIVGWFAITPYLISLTDKAVYDRLDLLLERVNPR